MLYDKKYRTLLQLYLDEENNNLFEKGIVWRMHFTH